MKAVWRKLRGTGGSATGQTAGKEKKRMGKAVKSMAYASIAGGLAIVGYGTLQSSLSLMLIGAGFLTTGIFTRSMMWETKDISEKLFKGQERILGRLDDVHAAIMGPPELDENGKPIRPDYAKNNLMSKMDELIAAVNRLADNKASCTPMYDGEQSADTREPS